MKAGFTLIEILISILIFSILIALASFSFSFYINEVKRIINPYPSEAINVSLLNDAIRSIFYFTESDKNILGKDRFFTYFYGNSNNIQFITAEPMYFKSISVCKLLLDNGTLKLEESPVYCKFNNYMHPTITKKCMKEIDILSNIKYIHITYYMNRKKLSEVKYKIPEYIKIELTGRSDKKTTLFFKIMSNFENKKELTQFMYATYE